MLIRAKAAELIAHGQSVAEASRNATRSVHYEYDLPIPPDQAEPPKGSAAAFSRSRI